MTRSGEVPFPAPGLAIGPDDRSRCAWCEGRDDYRTYHDEEWGRPETDDRALFEKVCLEGFQAGLSWITILRKRDDFRRVFAGFEIDAVAGFGEAEVERLLSDRSIVRHRGKIEAAIHNARLAQRMRAEFGSLAAFFWSYEPAPAERPAVIDHASVPATTPEATRLSRDLRRRGWRFVGPVTCYSFMQAMGLVNDHLEGCDFRAEVERERNALIRPTPTVTRSA